MNTPRFRPLTFGVQRIVLQDAAAGVQYLQADQDLQAYPERMSDRLKHWGEAAPQRTFMARRIKLADGTPGPGGRVGGASQNLKV